MLRLDQNEGGAIDVLIGFAGEGVGDAERLGRGVLEGIGDGWRGEALFLEEHAEIPLFGAIEEHDGEVAYAVGDDAHIDARDAGEFSGKAADVLDIAPRLGGADGRAYDHAHADRAFPAAEGGALAARNKAVAGEAELVKEGDLDEVRHKIVDREGGIGRRGFRPHQSAGHQVRLDGGVVVRQSLVRQADGLHGAGSEKHEEGQGTHDYSAPRSAVWVHRWLLLHLRFHGRVTPGGNSQSPARFRPMKSV